VAPSDATEKNRNIGAQLQSILYTASDFFGKFTSCTTFGAHKLVHAEPFLDYLYELQHLLSALHSDMRKKFLYRCTSTFSALNYFSGIFFKSLSYLVKSCAQTFAPIFGLFENFDRNFAKLVALASNNNKTYLVHLKWQSMAKE